MRKRGDAIVGCTEQCREPDGYFMAVPKSELGTKEHPNYVRAWLTYGLLAAHAAGNPKALPLLRRSS